MHVTKLYIDSLAYVSIPVWLQKLAAAGKIDTIPVIKETPGNVRASPKFTTHNGGTSIVFRSSFNPDNTINRLLRQEQRAYRPDHAWSAWRADDSDDDDSDDDYTYESEYLTDYYDSDNDWLYWMEKNMTWNRCNTEETSVNKKDNELEK